MDNAARKAEESKVTVRLTRLTLSDMRVPFFFLAFMSSLGLLSFLVEICWEEMKSPLLISDLRANK